MSDQPTEPTPTEETADGTAVFDTLRIDAASAAASAQPTPDPRGATTAAATTTPTAEPRVRSGAIAWGLIVSATAILLLAIVCVPANAAAFGDWTASLTPPVVVIIGVLALGAFILLMALLSLIRRAQRRRAAAARIG